jgi:Uncharacterized protein family UPF0029
VLVEMDVECGAVVVARWYGGVLLGPVRFSHIENCAREAIGNWRKESTSRKTDDHVAQKRKVEDEEKGRAALARILQDRDHSIHVLRRLLREKTEELMVQKAEETNPDWIDVNVSPTKPVNYSAMPLPVLKRLEKARDATIAWTLNGIEKVEKEQEQQQQKEVGTAKDCG